MMNVKMKKLGLVISTILSAQAAYALPQGSQVVQGAATFATPNASTLNVTNSNNAVINWQQFNIGAGQTTNFIQPNSSSSVLNRVIGNNPSQLLGNLNSNGQVYLINQHGILVGEGARINTNGFFASTLNITNEDFLNGNLKFAEGGLGDIDNKGYIHAGENGNVVLVAPNIENGGVIEVENGNVILAAGQSITITSLDNSSVEFHVQAADNKVTNLGSVIARNGAVNLFAGSLTHTGSIRSSGLVQDENGIVRLVALDSNDVSGSVDVSGEQGGKIEILGDRVAIKSGANIDASGIKGGGEILIGGDQQGLNLNVKNAISTTIENNATVTADATENGDGGRVIVFASNDVHVHEVITAKGGSISGDGGFIETSGLQQLDITAIPDASSSNGENGNWLIDPNNITIIATGGNDDAAYAGNGTNYTSSTDGTTIGADLITTSLDNGTNVIISTGSSGSELGDINVNSDIILSASTPGNLTLNAHNNININANINAGGIGQFDLTLNANIGASGGIVSFDNSVIDLGGGILTLSGNSVAINNAVSFVANTVNLSAPLVINSLATLTLGNGFTDVNVNNTVSFNNNGTLLINTGCSEGCNLANINGVFNNNGLIDYDINNGGELRITDTLNLGVGTSFNVVGGRAEARLTLASGSFLNVNAANVVMDLDMRLFLNNGTINNFQNLEFPDIFDIRGGNINFNQDIVAVHSNVNAAINILGTNVVRFNSSGLGSYFMYTGDINWGGAGATGDIVLNNTDLRILSTLNINHPSAGAQIRGTNGQLTLMGGSRLEHVQSEILNINVPVIANGTMEIQNAGELIFGSDLNIGSGGKLTGIGTYTAPNVIVGAGGSIAPGKAADNVASSDTGLLTINGNVTFQANSLAEFELDAASDGSVGTFDNLNVLGSVTIDNGSNLFVLWNNVTASNQPSDLGVTVFDFITTTGGITGSFTVFDPLLVTTSTDGVNGTSYQYDPTAFAGSVVFWSNGGNNNNWELGGNWSSGTVPIDGDNIIVETDQIIINFPTNNIGFAQINANTDLESTAVLNISNELYSQSDIEFNSANADIAGSGSWYNLGDSTFNVAGSNLSINVENFGSFTYLDFASAVDFRVSSTIFNNYGSVVFLSNAPSNGLDFSGSSFGLNNFGSLDIIMQGAQMTYAGVLNNNPNGLIDLYSDNDLASTFLFSNTNSNDGVINLNNNALSFANGVSYLFSAGSSLLGNGTVNIDTGSILAIEDNFTFVNGQTVNLSGGTLSVDGAVVVEDKLIWSLGNITGAGGSSFETGVNATTTLTSGILTGVAWTNKGLLNWGGSPNEIFSIINASLTNDATGIINIFDVVNLNRSTSSQAKSFSGGSGNFVNDGTLNLVNANLDLGSLTLLLGSSTSVLNGSGTVTGDVINSDGSVTIGNPNVLANSGAMVIDGNYTQGANGSLAIRIVDPVNGNFSFDTFAVNGLATLGGELQIAYFSNQVVSITEAFNPFSFASRNGIFDTLTDSNGNILNVDFSNGDFTILGTSSQVNVPLQDVLQSQTEFKKILKVLNDEDLNETLAFIKLARAESKDGSESKKEKIARLVCR